MTTTRRPIVTLEESADAALAAMKNPAVAKARTLYEEAMERHRREPWVVTTATVDVLRDRWADTLRAATYEILPALREYDPEGRFPG